MIRDISAAQLKALESFSVEVEVSLGRFALTGEQLLDLVPGKRVAFELEGDKLFGLSIEGEEVARARLLDDGEQLFLEIVEFVEKES